MDFRNCIISVTGDLVHEGQIFTEECRAKYLEVYFTLDRTPEKQKRQTKALTSEVGPTKNFCGSISGEDMEELPVSEWLNSLLSQKEIMRVKQTGLRATASCDINCNGIILQLKGKVLQKLAGYKLYQRYGLDYKGTKVFNLGIDFGYNWFCTKEYANTLQAEILQHGVQNNCEIYVLNLKSKPVPIIYATRNIKENEYLCLSKQNIWKWNEQFLSWNAVATENVRRSARVPNRGKTFEEMYESHLLSKQEDGLEIRVQNGKKKVFTTRSFSGGEFLAEYFGELIDKRTALDRFNSMPAELGSYIFFLGSRFKNYCIDATYTEGSISRFVRHSISKSNCKMMCKWIDKMPRLFLVAKCDIEKDTQLFYDYNDRNANFAFLRE